MRKLNGKRVIVTFAMFVVRINAFVEMRYKPFHVETITFEWADKEIF